MPYNGLKDGIYIIKRKAQKIGIIDHYGILDVGNLFNHPHSDGEQPIVYHMIDEGLTLQWLQDTGPDPWEVESHLKDKYIPDAQKRLNKASKNPHYNLFGNNCEHFARFIVEGEKYSTQLRVAAVIAGLGVLIYFAMREDN